MVIVFLILIALVAAPFILRAGREAASQLAKLWKDDVLGGDDNQPETRKDERHDDD